MLRDHSQTKIGDSGARVLGKSLNPSTAGPCLLFFSAFLPVWFLFYVLVRLFLFLFCNIFSDFLCHHGQVEQGLSGCLRWLFPISHTRRPIKRAFAYPRFSVFRMFCACEGELTIFFCWTPRCLFRSALKCDAPTLQEQ